MPKIFLIEDDFATIDVYKTAFKEADFKVDVASTGKEAMEKVERMNKGELEKPDLVLLDLILPDFNGMEILKEIRKGKETKDILLFILSNYTDYELEKIGYNLGTEKYLLKAEHPPSKLIKIIQERLKA